MNTTTEQYERTSNIYSTWCGVKSLPIGSMVLLYMVTFTINIPQMLAYIPYMDPMGYCHWPKIGCLGNTKSVCPWVTLDKSREYSTFSPEIMKSMVGRWRPIAIDTSVSHSCHVMFHCLITAGLEPWLVLGKTCHSCFGVLLHLPRCVALGTSSCTSSLASNPHRAPA